MWRAIWNGPFHIGKLERPISLGDVAMKVLETLWRTAILIGLLYGAVIGFVMLQGWQKDRTMKSAIRDTDIRAAINVQECSPAFPLSVIIRNDSGYIFRHVAYEISLVNPNNGQDVAPRRFSYLSHDGRIRPGESLMICLSLSDNSYVPTRRAEDYFGHEVEATIDYLRIAEQD